MISNGNATVHVSNLDAAIRFYTEQLGLTLTNRIGDRWATIEARPSYWTTDGANAGLVIGLRPPTALVASHAAPAYPPPGTTGSVGFGLEAYAPIEDVAAWFTARRVRIAGEIISFDAGNVFSFVDLDGLASYVHQFPPHMIDEEVRNSETYQSRAREPTLAGGHAIIYVSNMDAAIRFYTDTLGLKLTYRFENRFATVEVGRSLVLAIHPQTSHTPVPGTKGSVTLGLVVDEPIDAVLSQLAKRGVRVTGRSEPRAESRERSVDIEDPDGNVIRLWESDAHVVGDTLATAGAAART